jgi:molybdate transport system substrate-binding protein
VKRLAALLALLLAAGCSSGGGTASAEEPLLVAAASDLQPAFTELGELYTAQTGRPVVFTFGSSGQLAQQLRAGAPHEVFASASVGYVEEVLAAGRGDASTQAGYAVGRLAVWAGGEQVSLEQLAEPRFRRIAIANPQHAPYGLAAQQALESSGVLEAVRERLVYGENVSDTLRLATSGNADAAVVALSLVLAQGGRHTEVPEQAHLPLRQALLVTAAPERARAARAFTDLVASPRGRALMSRHGFRLPDENPPGR